MATAENRADALAVPRPVSLGAVPQDAAAENVGDAIQRQIDQLANDDDLLDPGEKARRFVMSLCSDQQGRLWVGCEDSGVWCFDQQAAKDKQWTQYTRKNTGGPDEPNGATIEAGNWLGDDNGYALACDKLGRIWVGHLNHGVSVFNGKQWKNYGVLEGPLGERVFAIKTCPTDGDVWIATSAGLTRYSLSKDTWTYYTRAEGLPSDQASAIAFDPQGNIIIGTQCDGLAFADARDDYKTWRQVTCPKEYEDRVPLVPKGQGLPTNLINDVLVAKDGTIYVATTTGLAWSKDGGKAFEFVRGKEWAEKVRGLYGGAPKDWREEGGIDLVSEDYLTHLGENRDGGILVGTWLHGLAIRGGPPISLTGYVRDFCVPDNGAVIAGTYGQGVTLRPTALSTSSARNSFPVLPNPCRPPSADMLRTMLNKLSQPATTSPKAAFIGQDWRTQGDWVGRYGRQYAVLCSGNWPMDHFVSHGADYYQVNASLGPHIRAKDSLRHWLHWETTTDHRVLYNPVVGHRRHTEWDDHSESYPPTFEGPNVLIRINVPPGMQRLTLYFMNKDGHSGLSSRRDFLVEVQREGDVEVLARSRVKDFWGGVYHSFAVGGQGAYVLTIRRNTSFCAFCSAVLIDRLSGPTTTVDTMPLPWLGDSRYLPPDLPDSAWPFDSTAILARDLWRALDQSQHSLSTVPEQWPDRVAAFRVAHPTSELAEGRLRWDLRLWSAYDRGAFDKTMSESWQQMIRRNLHLLTKRLPTLSNVKSLSRNAE